MSDDTKTAEHASMIRRAATPSEQVPASAETTQPGETETPSPSAEAPEAPADVAAETPTVAAAEAAVAVQAADAEASTGVPLTAGERAKALRQTLSGLREVDALRAEANRIKEQATAEADQILTQAQALSTEMRVEAIDEAAEIVSRAHAEADGVRQRTEDALGELRAGFQDVESHLQVALRSVGTMLGTLDGVRTPPATPAPAAEPLSTLPDVVPPEAYAAERTAETQVVPHDTTYLQREERRDEQGARPLGWLFRASSQA
ncbi:hypothetical protein [Nocardioides lijunqiniae]|uniref:hypothetical protein n=1 Tax=Nocardioides lijunqiniae TaxID=2760832 RepID=UPI001877F874|nr:hypothetical protein [Nocardioides lijunqiniae]